MGAHNLDATVWFDGKQSDWEYNEARFKDVSAAYRHLVERSDYLDGHDSYSGGFNTTSGVRAVRLAPVTVDEAERIAHGAYDSCTGKSTPGRIDNLSKWEHVEAIPVVRTIEATYGPAVEQNVTLTFTAAQATDPAKITAAVRKAVGAKKGDTVEFRIATKKTPGYSWQAALHKVATKVKAVTGKEKIVTRYFVVTEGALSRVHGDAGGKQFASSGTWESGFDSVAKAREALSGVGVKVGHQYEYQTTEVEVVGLTRRAEGSPILTATVEAKSVEVTYSVTVRPLVKAAKHGTEHAGWYIYGWAAS